MGHQAHITTDGPGADPGPQCVWAGLAEYEKALLGVDLTLVRRQLTDAHKVQLGQDIELAISARAMVGMEAGKPMAPELAPPMTDAEKLVASLDIEPRETLQTFVRRMASGETRDEVAVAVGLGSGRTYERPKQTLDQSDAIVATTRAALVSKQALLNRYGMYAGRQPA